MLFPTISDYKNALVIPESFATLGSLRPEKGLIDDVYFSSGNFAVVFKMRDTQTGKLYAVKCFTREQDRRVESLESISDYLEAVKSPYLVPYTFLKDEIWVNDADYPVLLMDWVDGVTLGEKVKALCDKRDTEGLHRLTIAFAEMALWLLDQDWAHGDLKHDNIIVRPDNTLALVDYDGCFVPAMAGQNAREIGSPCYRHPKRAAQHFDRHIDDFSVLVIFLSLRALVHAPELLTQHHNGENMVLTTADFSTTTPLLADLRGRHEPILRGAVALLEFALAMPSGQVFGLKEGLSLKFFEQEKQTIHPSKNNNRLPFEPEMVFVQGGSFQMGNDDGRGDEKPVHTVTVSNFYIGKYPVTQAEWIAIMDANPSQFKGDKLPVERVSWNDTQEYIQKLSEKTGRKYRLPTEAEWEYAARGGNQSKGCLFSGSNDINDVAWNQDNSGSKTHPVGTKKANELGVFDMSGNVWEWCNDYYDENYYKNSPTTNPQGAAKSDYRSVRGGSWNVNYNYCRVSIRVKYSSVNRFSLYGFRVVWVSQDK